MTNLSEREPIQTILLRSNELARRFPCAEEWLADPNHRTAQVLNGNRLASAEEKIARFGGADNVRKSLEQFRGDQTKPFILLACMESPMTTAEIIIFAQELGKELSFTQVNRDLRDLLNAEDEAKGELKRINGITYIRRSTRSRPFQVTTNRQGFETTDLGLQVLTSHFFSH